MSNVASAPPPLPPKRRKGIALIPLNELAHQPLTKRDLLLLLPALILSLMLNGAFVGSVLLFSRPPQVAVAAAAQSNLQTTKFEPKKPGEELVDPNAEELPIGDPDIKADVKADLEPPLPEAPPILAPLKDPESQQGLGTGMEPGIQGLDGAGALGISGMPLVDKGYGFTGNGGAGPLGEGFGILDGKGGGKLTAGGHGLRQGDLNKLAPMLGATDESQRAVALGLKWLKMHQNPNGLWSFENYHRCHGKDCGCRVPIEDGNNIDFNDTAATALGLMPFLGAGHTHLKATPYRETVFSAIEALRRRMDKQGYFGGTMYGHGLATIALCEAYSLTKDPKLRDSAQRAVDFIAYAQNPRTGGWRYQPRTNGDTSVVGWQVMALESAAMADLKVNPQTLDLATKWLDACQVKVPSLNNPAAHRIAYQYMPGEYTSPALTAVGVLGREYLGWGPKHPDLISGCEYLIERPPPRLEEYLPGEKLELYYWYYATQALHHMSGDYFSRWNPRIRDLLVKTQEREGHKAGSWDPTIADYGNRGGRIYATSMAVLTLEVYYRYLPLYRRDFLMDAPKN
jgi:hypothetical protein